MKIGILTYNKANNYGAVLQSYALTETIISVLNCNCEIINYNSDFFDEIYRKKSIFKSKNIKELIKAIITYRSQNTKDINFKKFESKYLKLSSKEYKKNTIVDANSEYDIFVVGSDQVWNFDLNGNDSTYGLDFVRGNNCVSYAASLGGNHISEFGKIILGENLKKYKLISVREKSAIELLKKIESGRKIVDVLDPTLLLEKGKWEKLIGKRIIKEDYVFLYKVADTPTIMKYITKNHKNTKKIVLHNSYKKYKGFNNLNDISPIEFLNLIYYASVVYSTSFHGICFSIIFNKDFYYELDSKSYNNNTRIDDLIKNLGLHGREIVNENIVDSNKIDYEIVNEKLKKYKEKSIGFIKKIGDTYEK